MFKIISDGACDFSKDEVKKYNIDIVPFYISFDGLNYLKEGIDISRKDFFNRLVSDKTVFPKTAQPNPQDYVDIFIPYLDKGVDILCITVSSKVSGSNNSAKMAVDMLADDYPDRSIVLLDTLNGSVAQGLILKEIIKMRDAGLSLDKTTQIAENIINSAKQYFTVETLEYLKRGGRVGPTTALVGSILGIRPILQVEDGMISQLDSVRGKSKTLKLIEEAMVEALKDDVNNISIAIGHVFREEDANALKANIGAGLNIQIPSPLVEMGAVIGAHAGPGALVFAYCKKYEEV
ncbi:MAG: DegV family protein [Defluviitaleaceae bacterium]|nr:DegV family protein [Defluviitaleaceae bacterium]